MNSLLTISGIDSALIASTDEARAARDKLLARAIKGTAVTTSASAENAGSLLKDLKEFSRTIEASRAEVKAPVLEMGKKIDGLARELTHEIEVQAQRVSRLLGVWQAEQSRLAEEARRKAWETEQEIILAAQQKAREEAAKAQAELAELNAKAERARSDTKAAEWAQKAAEAKERAEAASVAHVAATEQQIVEVRVNASANQPPKPVGLSTRAEICFEIENIELLYGSAPFLVSLVPNNAAIKAALKGLSAGQKLLGVKHWVEKKAIVR